MDNKFQHHQKKGRKGPVQPSAEPNHAAFAVKRPSFRPETKIRTKSTKDEHYGSPEPLVVRPQTDHPLFLCKTEKFETDASQLSYIRKAKKYINFWMTKDDKKHLPKLLDVIVEYYFFLVEDAKKDSQSAKSLKLLDEALNTSAVGPMLSEAEICVTDRFGNEIAMLNMKIANNRPLKTLLAPQSLPKTLKRVPNLCLTSRVTLFVVVPRPPTASSPSSSSSDETSSDEEEEEYTYIMVNEEEKTLTHFIKEHGLKKPLLLLKKQYAIERNVFARNGIFQIASELKKIAAPENWGKADWVLQNFIDQTFLRQMKQSHIIPLLPSSKKIQCMHMNILNSLAQPIFMVLYYDSECYPVYRFHQFNTLEGLLQLYQTRMNEGESVPSKSQLQSQFPRPSYFSTLQEVIFDNTLEVNKESIRHILGDNRQRIKDQVPFSRDEKALDDWFCYELRKQLEEASYNYRLMIPQFYDNSVQLLLPLYYESADGPKVGTVCALKRENNQYFITTALCPSWAYNNARILGKIESSWLLSTMADCLEEDVF